MAKNSKSQTPDGGEGDHEKLLQFVELLRNHFGPPITVSEPDYKADQSPTIWLRGFFR